MKDIIFYFTVFILAFLPFAALVISAINTRPNDEGDE